MTKERLNSGYLFKVKMIGLDLGPNVGRARRRGISENHKSKTYQVIHHARSLPS